MLSNQAKLSKKTHYSKRIDTDIKFMENALCSEKNITTNSRTDKMRLCCRLIVGTMQHIAYTIIFIYSFFFIYKPVN
jgi:hypothetical protein